jgi:hypothetical protein
MAKFQKKINFGKYFATFDLISRFPLVAFFFKLVLFYYLETYQCFIIIIIRLSILCCSQIGDDPIGRFSQSWQQANYDFFFHIYGYYV